MNAIPWYSSRVFIGAVVSIISQLLVLIGKQDVIPVDVITSNVEAFFQLVALAAAGYAAWKRKASDVQPLTVSKKAADVKNTQAGYATTALLAMIAVTVSLMALSACVTTPVDVVQVACQDAKQSPARCAKGIAETWEVYQKRAEELVTDPTTPVEAKKAIQRTEARSREVIVGMLNSAAEYKRIEDQLAAGTTQEEKLLIANANLADWVNRALPLLKEFGNALGIK